ncbi:MAG: hypothetical protein HC906_08010 [Bacteroidales bacterium]|nr:hypothetical protein [Bacteroidales bacterium]
MSIHFRHHYSGTIIYDNGTFSKINTKTKVTMAPASYTAWHPDGNLIAYTVCKLNVTFSSDKNKVVEVWDKNSDLIVYNVKTNTVTTSPKISTHDRENLPFWSPDGKWLYFISAPEVNDSLSNIVYERYNLLRIGFDPEKLAWGNVDTLLTSKQTGKSITFPAVSPDGRYVTFCMIDHSYFSIFDRNSDLYLLDLETRKVEKADVINSNSTDSYHTWSKNGRWMVFSSKRIDDICTRPYFTYFDVHGKFHKPFVLPQKDPSFYLEDARYINLPTLVNGKVPIKNNEMRDFITQKEHAVVFDQNVDIDALSGATWLQTHGMN